MPFLGPLIKATIALFIITDPLGLIPVFMALTQSFTPEERRKTLSQATFVALLLLLLFAFTGTGILKLLGITLEDFEIAGPSTPLHAQFSQRVDYGSLWVFGVKGSF